MTIDDLRKIPACKHHWLRLADCPEGRKDCPTLHLDSRLVAVAQALRCNDCARLVVEAATPEAAVEAKLKIAVEALRRAETSLREIYFDRYSSTLTLETLNFLQDLLRKIRDEAKD